MARMFKTGISILTLLIICGMALVIFLVSRQGELPKIDGREEILAGKLRPEKLFDRMQLAFNTKDTCVVSERELNHYLASQLKVSQGGKFGKNAKVRGLWVDLRKDWLMFYLERVIEIEMGTDEQGKQRNPYKQNHITQFGFKIETIEHADMSIEKKISPGAGKIGGMFAPGLFGKLAKAPLEDIADLFQDELGLFKTMTQIRVFEGRLEMSSAVNTIVKPVSSSGKK